MKLLFDMNISHRLNERLIDIFPQTVRVRDIGLECATDRDIWEYAKSNDCTIVSKDEDFHHMSLLYGAAETHLTSPRKLQHIGYRICDAKVS